MLGRGVGGRGAGRRERCEEEVREREGMGRQRRKPRLPKFCWRVRLYTRSTHIPVGVERGRRRESWGALGGLPRVPWRWLLTHLWLWRTMRAGPGSATELRESLFIMNGGRAREGDTMRRKISQILGFQVDLWDHSPNLFQTQSEFFFGFLLSPLSADRPIDHTNSDVAFTTPVRPAHPLAR